MQKHPVCRDQKVIYLAKIFESLQKEFPDPPASKLFIAINRPLLEKEASDPKSQKSSCSGELKGSEPCCFSRSLGRTGEGL